MPSALLVLAGLVLGALVGYLAGWIRRDRTVTTDSLDWWRKGWDAAMQTLRNPLQKTVSYATLDELAPHVIEGERE